MSLDSATFFLNSAHLVRDVRSYCFASLTLMVWDTLLTFSDEVDCIWRIPWKSRVKWFYFYFRYVTLAVNSALVLTIVHLTSADASASTCKAWMVSMFLFNQLTGTFFEFILALCVYALCNRRRHVAILLGALMGGEIITAGLITWTLISETSFATVCIMIDPPKWNAIYPFFIGMTQHGLIWFILFKAFLASRARWGRTPLVSLLVKRMATTQFLLIPLLSLALIMVLKADNRSIVVITWAISLLSICACRLIIGLERLGADLGTETQQPEFTSQIELM